MSDRVSDGLLAELRRKMDDGTPRGMVWPILADMFVACAEFASTPEEVTEANEVLAALLLELMPDFLSLVERGLKAVHPADRRPL